MEVECDDRPHPQEVALSQTCWEYKTLLHQRNRAKRQHDDVAVRVDRAAVPSSNISSNIDHHHQQQQQHHHHHHGQDSGRGANRPPSQPPKRHKPNPPVSKRHKSQPPRANAGRSVAAITSIQTLRLSGSAQRDDTRLRDLFVLVLQTSGLQQITSRAGFDVDFGTLLVADPSSAFLRVTLWRNAARVGARLIRAGDLVRLNRVGVSTFRGTVQAHSTLSTRFRVVWRGDTFTTRDDGKATTMLSHSQPSNFRGREGGTARFRSDPALSQDDDDLAVPREDACHLAAWAKSEFPSVVSTDSTDSRWRHQTVPGAAAGAEAVVVGSLGTVRQGVETTVRACVLNISDVERLWVWDSVAGKRRKDLISRANALITDGMHQEMTLQLWGDLACEETIAKLREGAVAAQAVQASPGARKRPIKTPTVFEFTELQPEFSFSCEALVLNGKGGKLRTLPPDSPEAMRVSEAVVAAATALLETGQNRDEAVSAGSTVAFGSAETSSQAEAGLTVGGVAALPRRFESVAALMSADGFSGACRLRRAVVRKVDAHYLSSALRPPVISGNGGTVTTLDSRHRPGLRRVSLYVGDGEESLSELSGVDRSGGVEAVIRVNVDGGALNDLLGCNPKELCALAADANVEVEDSKDGGGVGVQVEIEVARVLWSLLEGLEVGGERGERVDLVLACSASVDANGWITPGGSCYRLVSLHPSRD